MGYLIPEIALKKIVDYFLKSLTEDYLDLLFGDAKLDNYVFSKEAKQIFLSPEDYPRKVKSNLFFNRERAIEPTIHIGLPGELPGPADGLGFDEEIDRDGDSLRDFTHRTYSARYGLVFTSSNTFEVLIMYYTLKSLFQGNVGLLEANGFSNPKFSGEDIVLGSDIIPCPIYSRRMLIESFQDFKAPSLETGEKPITNIEFINNCSNGKQ